MTLPDILQAGYRAEAEGRLDYAAQLYRHLVDYYGRSPEAGEARRALARLAHPVAAEPAREPSPAYRSLSQVLDEQPQPSQAPQAPRPFHAPEPVGPMAPAMTSGQAPAKSTLPVRMPQAAPLTPLELPPPANGYRLGRALAVLVMVLAALLTGLGLLLLGYGTVNGLYRPTPAGFAPMAAAPGMIVAGLLLALLAQLFLAIFRTANATADLAAIARARARHEGGEG